MVEWIYQTTKKGIKSKTMYEVSMKQRSSRKFYKKNKHRKKYPSLYFGDQWSMRVCACVGNEHLNIFAEILERRQQQH